MDWRRTGLRMFWTVYRFWRRVRRKTIRIMLEENASPHQIALGCAVGMFIAGMPWIGLQMVTAVFIENIQKDLGPWRKGSDLTRRPDAQRRFTETQIAAAFYPSTR